MTNKTKLGQPAVHKQIDQVIPPATTKTLCLAKGCAELPVAAGGGRGGRIGTAHAGTAKAGGGEPIGAAVDHDQDGWNRGSGRMRRGYRVARGDAACSEGSLMMVPSGAVRVLVATRPVDFRKGHGWPRRAGAREPVC